LISCASHQLLSQFAAAAAASAATAADAPVAAAAAAAAAAAKLYLQQRLQCIAGGSTKVWCTFESNYMTTTKVSLLPLLLLLPLLSFTCSNGSNA
jgi:hypothetical protein